MKVFISADIEGVAGVVSWDQTRRQGYEYDRACGWMTGEVAAACQAALALNASRVVVADSHGTGQNLILDALPEEVETVRAWPRPLGMVQGVDLDAFDHVFCLGYHTGASEIGMLNHTCNGAGFFDVRLNGKSVDELDIYSGVAAHFGAPVTLTTGDEAYCASVNRRYPVCRTVPVKTATGRVTGHSISPAAARQRIAEAVHQVLSEPAPERAMPLKDGLRLEIDFKWHHAAETLCYLDGFERVGAHTVGIDVKDHLAVARILEFLSNFKLTPDL
ncbi:MAG: M55 family metallopeptidase [Pseudomonadota bacterium]